MNKITLIIVLIFIVSSCSIFYPWKTEQQKVLSEFVEYIYYNKNTIDFDNIDKYPMIKIDFLKGGNMSKNDFREMLKEYPDGIELCNIERDITSSSKGKEKMISLYYKVDNSYKKYFKFVFRTDLKEDNYIFSYYSIRTSNSCNPNEINRL